MTVRACPDVVFRRLLGLAASGRLAIAARHRTPRPHAYATPTRRAKCACRRRCGTDVAATAHIASATQRVQPKPHPHLSHLAETGAWLSALLQCTRRETRRALPAANAPHAHRPRHHHQASEACDHAYLVHPSHGRPARAKMSCLCTTTTACPLRQVPPLPRPATTRSPCCLCIVVKTYAQACTDHFRGKASALDHVTSRHGTAQHMIKLEQCTRSDTDGQRGGRALLDAPTGAMAPGKNADTSRQWKPAYRGGEGKGRM